jgi:uncharacterized protein YraI
MGRLFTSAVRACVLLALVTGCTLNLSPDGSVPQASISGVPQVRIVSPLPNATYLTGVSVNIQAAVSNAGADIDRVEIAVNDGIVATVPNPNSAGLPAFSITHAWPAASPGAYTISVSAFRSDGSSSAPASVSVRVVAQGSGSVSGAESTAEATGDALATEQVFAPTSTIQPTAEATEETTSESSAGASSGPPVATVREAINVRRGPGLNFPAIGTFTQGQAVEILATNPASDWYKVRFGTGEGWVFGGLLNLSGDLASVPREAGPPTPTPVPPTPVVPTAVIPTATTPPTVNLVAGIVVLAPEQPRCNETFTIGLDVANLGTTATTTGGLVSLQDARLSDGSVQQTTEGAFPVLQPGQTVRIEMRLTVATWYNEDHRLVLRIDPSNQIAETDENDNNRDLTYRLEKANCA